MGEHLYLQLAGEIEKMIQDEVLQIGNKLPSVRQVSEERGVSMGTAFQAYYHLEAKGLIESRPKSGYYVRFNMRRMPGVPEATEADPVTRDISVRDMMGAVFSKGRSGELLNLSVAAPPMELLPAAKLNKSLVHAMRALKDHGVQYEEIQGNRELRRQLAKQAFAWKGRFSEEDVVVTAGCMEALAVCLKAVTVAGDTVAIENPTYFGILQVLEGMGLKALELPSDPATGVDPGKVEVLMDRMPIKALVLVTNFSNPMGSCMPDENKRRLVEVVTRRRIPLIEDDIYGEMYFGEHRPGTCKAFDREGWVLYCSSLSKSLAPGYRIGWTLPGRFKEEVMRQKLMHTVTGTTITQAAMAHFLGIGRYEFHLKKLRRSLQAQCLQYMQGIVDYFPADIKVSRPQGGFVLWVELDRGIDAFELYQRAVRQQISIAPGQLFSGRGQFANCLRISYARPWDEDIARGLRVLGRLIRELTLR